jgi:transposase
MIAPGEPVQVYVATRPVDFRKGHDGLAAAVQEMFGLDPFSGAVFVFRSNMAAETGFGVPFRGFITG